MAIDGPALFESKATEFRRSVNDTDFADAYIKATNQALVAVCALVDEAQAASITDTQTDIALDAIYQRMLSYAIDRELVKVGLRTGQMSLPDIERLFFFASNEARTVRDITTQQASTDGLVFGTLSDD